MSGAAAVDLAGPDPPADGVLVPLPPRVCATVAADAGVVPSQSDGCFVSSFTRVGLRQHRINQTQHANHPALAGAGSAYAFT